ncbi:hypothetical protein ACFXGK_26005 [Streptomyces albidoflavus]
MTTIPDSGVPSWATADHLRTDPVAEALTAACRQRRPTYLGRSEALLFVAPAEC